MGEVKIPGKLQPGYLLVEPLEVELEKKTTSGIILPDGSKADSKGNTAVETKLHPFRLKVIKKADDVTWLEEGDTVIPSPQQQQTIWIDSKLKPDEIEKLQQSAVYIIHESKAYRLMYKNDIIMSYGKL